MHKRLKTARAYAMLVTIQDIYDTSFERATAEGRLKQLYNWLVRSHFSPIKKFAGLIKNHWQELLRPPLHQRYPGGHEQHHSEYQAPCP